MKPEIAVPMIAGLVYRAWSHKSLTPVGIATAFVTAVVHAIHPWGAFFLLLATFFLAGTAVTKVRLLEFAVHDLVLMIAGQTRCQGQAHTIGHRRLGRRGSAQPHPGHSKLWRRFGTDPAPLLATTERGKVRKQRPLLPQE